MIELGFAIVIIFLAAIVRGFSGFGFSLLAITALSLIYTPAEIVPSIFIVNLVVFGRQVRNWMLHMSSMPVLVRLVWSGLYIVASLLIALFVLSVIYRVGCPGNHDWNFIVPGAGVATVLWWVVSISLGFYLRIVPYSLVYGGLAVTIGLMLWMQLTATILDFPQTIDTAKHYARKAGLAARIAHLGGNAITTDWPSGHDVILMSYVWSAVGDEDVRILAQRAMEALPPGGLVLVHDFMVDNAHEGPPFAAWYLLGSIIDNPNAVCLTPSYVEDVLRQVGFNVERTEMMLPGITMLTRATKAPKK